MTSKLLRAQESGELVSAPDHRLGGSATEAETRFANGCIALLLAPFAIAADVVLFPVQIIGGYSPYGDREF